MARRIKSRTSKRKTSRPKRSAKTASRRAGRKGEKKAVRVPKRSEARKPAAARKRASAGKRVRRATDLRIDRIDPNRVNRSTAVTLTLSGGDFTPDCIVLIDDANPGYRYVSSAQLQASLSERDTATPGRKGVKVHGGTGGALSNTVYLTIE
jgi:hypothetical protein